MSGGKVTVGGTNYTVKGGRTLVGGTGYSIKKGRTTVNATNYSINFKDMTLQGLLKNASVKRITGVDSKSAEYISIFGSVGAGTYYVFGFQGTAMFISKVVLTSSSHTETNIKRVGSCYIYWETNTSGYLSVSQTRGGEIRGTAAVIQFPDYTVAEADTILATASPSVAAGRSYASTGNVSVAGSTLSGKIAIMATDDCIAFNKFTSASAFTNLAYSGGYGNLTYVNSGTVYLGYNGASIKVRCGSIVTL